MYVITAKGKIEKRDETDTSGAIAVRSTRAAAAALLDRMDRCEHCGALFVKPAYHAFDGDGLYCQEHAARKDRA